MKKLYYIVIAIGVIVFAYFIVSSLPEFSKKFLTVANDSINNSSFSYTGSFAFKSTPEREDLVKEMININSKFITDPPLSFPDTKNDIKYFYKLENYFPEFKYYYITKLKVQDTLFNELPLLYNNTYSLSKDELQTYFNTNIQYLVEKWGVNNFDEFYDLVLTIKELNGENVSKYELEESYFYMANKGAVIFRIILTTESNSSVYLAVKSEVYNSTDYQSSPVVKFIGTVLGGRS